jgi:hypothetical protein
VNNTFYAVVVCPFSLFEIPSSPPCGCLFHLTSFLLVFVVLPLLRWLFAYGANLGDLDLRLLVNHFTVSGNLGDRDFCHV